MSARQRLKELLRERSLKRGQFELSSGRKSDYYLDARLTTLHPEGAVATGRAILELLAQEKIQAEAIGGMALGADPIVSAVVTLSQLEGKPVAGFLVRKRAKAHGGQKRLEGFEGPAGARVVIVDDVCTTGASTLKAIAAAEQRGYQVVAVVSLVDREEGGSQRIRQRGYNYHTLFNARELGEER
ncbi:MAG: orotate phosphoribosyltransferase [Terriglobia bacterium]